MQSERVWNSIKYIWGPLLILDAQGISIGELKPKHEWEKVNNEGTEANAKALFSIFNKVCPNGFHMIVNYKSAKEAWDILQVTHEGTSATKISKLQMYATKFENIRVHESHFSFFYSKLSDIVNYSFNLGEPIPNQR